jgi:hypothetical protein
MALMTNENYQNPCKCGHSLIAHVHYNGDLGLPDNQTTYCGVPTESGECDCFAFRPAQICKCGHKIGFHCEEGNQYKCFGEEGCRCAGYEIWKTN